MKRKETWWWSHSIKVTYVCNRQDVGPCQRLHICVWTAITLFEFLYLIISICLHLLAVDHGRVLTWMCTVLQQICFTAAYKQAQMCKVGLLRRMNQSWKCRVPPHPPTPSFVFIWKSSGLAAAHPSSGVWSVSASCLPAAAAVATDWQRRWVCFLWSLLSACGFISGSVFARHVHSLVVKSRTGCVAVLFEVTTCLLARSCVLMETNTVKSPGQSGSQWPLLFCFIFSTSTMQPARSSHPSSDRLFALLTSDYLTPQPQRVHL